MLLTFSTKTEANEKPKQHLVEPKAQLITDCSGKRYMGFDMDDAVLLSHIITDYHLLWSYSESLEEDIGSLKLELKAEQQSTILWMNWAKKNEKRGNLYLTMYEKRNRQALKLEKRNKLKWIPWAIIGLETIAFSIFIAAR